MRSGFSIATDMTTLTNISDLRRHASFTLTRVSICLRVSSNTSVHVTYPCTGSTRIKCASRRCRTFGGPKNASGTGVHAQPQDACAPSLFPCASSVLLFPRPLMLLPRRVCKYSGIQGLGGWRGRPSFCSSGFGLCRPYWTRVLACVLHVHVWLCIPNAVDADTHLYFIHAVMSQTLARVKRNVRVQRTAQASTRFHHPSNWAV